MSGCFILLIRKCFHAKVCTQVLPKSKQTNKPDLVTDWGFINTWVLFSVSYSLSNFLQFPAVLSRFHDACTLLKLQLPSGDCWVLRRGSRGGLFSRVQRILSKTSLFKWRRREGRAPGAQEKTSGLLWLCLWEAPTCWKVRADVSNGNWASHEKIEPYKNS